MHLEETPEQLALRAELRAYFAELLTDEVRQALDTETEGGEVFRSLVRRMGKDGWLGIGWPKEFGGQGRPTSDQFIFFTEVQRARAPFPFVTLNTVGPMIMRSRHRGAEELLPVRHPGRRDQLRHRLHRARGRHRPGLAAHPGRAGRRRVDHQRQQDLHQRRRPGRLHLAGHPHRPRRPQAQGHLHLPGAHLVARASPARRWSRWAAWPPPPPTTTTSGCPSTALVGELNEGWRLITGQLNHERVGLAAVSALAQRLWVEAAEWVVDHDLADVGWVQADLARTYALLEAQKLLNWRMTAAVADDTLGPADSSAVKVFGTESTVEIYRRLLGSGRCRRLPEPRVPRGGAPRRARAGRPPGPDQHLRRRGQRGPAGDPGHGRPGHEAVVAVSTATATAVVRAGSRRRSTRSTSSCRRSWACPPGPAPRAADPVNVPMIRHWVEAMGDHNPVYVDEEAARDAGFPRDHRPAHHAPGLDHAWPAGLAGGRRGPGRRGGRAPTHPATR